MRHPILTGICMCGALLVTACGETKDSEVDRAFLKDLNVVDDNNLSDVMLNVADPDEAVSYFQRTLKENPDRLDLRRGLAASLARSRRNTEAIAAWRQVVAHKDSTDEDRVELADVLIRNGDWDEADAVLDGIPPTHETFHRYRLEAMVADSNKEWAKSDSFYEIALGLTTTPAGVMNNWGYSKLTRGDFADAERLFSEAIRQDDTLFTAKNNLVLARGAQKKYALPVIKTSQIERAQLLYTLGLSAIKQGDTAIGKGLLRDAIDTHPQHFEAASRSLSALEGNVD